MEENEMPFILTGKFSNLVAVNIGGFIMGCLVLIPFFFLPGYGTTFLFFAYPILAIWMFGDAVVWQQKGVHELHISKEGIKVFRGISRRESFVLPEQITDLHVHQRMNRKSLNIMLEQQVQRIPGVFTYYPGKRIHLTNDAFNDKEFDRAIELLEELYKKRVVFQTPNDRANID